MAHQTKDKKKSFTNKPQADAYDRQNPVQSSAATHGMSDEHDDGMDEGAPENTQDGMNSPDGNAMASEHGPAHKIVMQHDEGSGQHHVQVTHPDGHEHMTQHGSAGAAHKFAADCAGAESM